MSKTTFKVGDKVRVHDEGIKMLQKFAPPGSKPQDEGVVSEIMDDGDLLVLFPIGNDDPEEHSQAVPYPPSQCEKI